MTLEFSLKPFLLPSLSFSKYFGGTQVAVIFVVFIIIINKRALKWTYLHLILASSHRNWVNFKICEFVNICDSCISHLWSVDDNISHSVSRGSYIPAEEQTKVLANQISKNNHYYPIAFISDKHTVLLQEFYFLLSNMIPHHFPFLFHLYSHLETLPNTSMVKNIYKKFSWKSQSLFSSISVSLNLHSHLCALSFYDLNHKAKLVAWLSCSSTLKYFVSTNFLSFPHLSFLLYVLLSLRQKWIPSWPKFG